MELFRAGQEEEERRLGEARAVLRALTAKQTDETCGLIYRLIGRGHGSSSWSSSRYCGQGGRGVRPFGAVHEAAPSPRRPMLRCRAVSLLREIQEAAVDAKTPLAVVLRKCMILAARLGHEPFKKW